MVSALRCGLRHAVGAASTLVAALLLALPSAAQTQGRTVSIHDLATLRDITGLSVSPDGAWAAVQVRQADPQRNSYALGWYVVDARDGAAARRIADAGAPILYRFQGRVNGAIKATPPAWSPDSKWIAYLREDNGRIQVWRSHRDGRRAEQLTRNDADVRALAYSRDGRRLLYETERSNAQIEAALAREARAGFLYDRRFFPTYSTHPTLPADAAFEGMPDRSQSQIAERQVWAYEFASRRERPATEAEHTEFVGYTNPLRPSERPAFRTNAASSPGGALAWTEARDPERQGYFAPLTIVARAERMSEPVVCQAAECTSQTIRALWWRNESEIIFASGEGPSAQDTVLYAWRPKENSLRLVLRTPGKLVPTPSEWSCAVAQERLVCFYEESTRPRRLVAVNLDSGAIQTLFDPNPEFTAFDLGAPPQRIEIRTRSGVEAYGYLVLPPRHLAGERLPLVIVTYRCSGFLRGGTGDEYPIYPFAAEGFAVFCFNVPDSDYERWATDDPVTYVNWARGPGEPQKRRVQDALDAAVTQLDDMGLIDSNRVGLTGLSFGAETVSFALLNMPRVSTAIASAAGFEPMDYYLYGPAGGGESFHAWGLGAPHQTPERWREFALTLNADRVRAPLLLNVADHEMLSSVAPVVALREAHRAVEMFVFPDEYHVKWQPAHRLSIYERNIDWMNFWLRDVEDSDSSKAPQYGRWRTLRETVETVETVEAPS
jgi:dipeptidyl aminopeptidase/acylaminoacyl peptidase